MFQDFWGWLTSLPLMCRSAGNCTNYEQQFDRVFSVPGEMAMLNSTLVTGTVFDHTAEPYNITWYDTRTGRAVSSEAGRILVRGETLWFLNVTLDDSGEYLSVVRWGSGEGRSSHVVFSPFWNIYWYIFGLFSLPELLRGATNKPPCWWWSQQSWQSAGGPGRLIRCLQTESMPVWPVRWGTVWTNCRATTFPTHSSGTKWVEHSSICWDELTQCAVRLIDRTLLWYRNSRYAVVKCNFPHRHFTINQAADKLWW